MTPPPSEPEAPREVYELELLAEDGDIDVLGHVNNVVYVRWVQEAAIAHWTSATTEAQRSALAWVVARHEIDYRRSAVAGDRIVARTWVGVATRNSFERHTALVRRDGGELLARARTVWVPIDPATGRIKSPSADIRERFSIPAPASASSAQPSEDSR